MCLILAAVVACGGDSTGPGARAASVAGFAGDSQQAPTGGAFQYPLSFITLGSNGQPIPDVHVSWSVTPAGAATFTPQTSVSDANGQVTTTVTAGPTPQQITVHANVPGVTSPVVFKGLVLDPCTFVRAVSVGDTINGNLSAADCHYLGNAWFYDFYSLGLPAGQQSVRIAMQSTVFDTWIDLLRTDSTLVGFDDDVVLSQNQNSQLDIIFPGDVYLIGANSYDQGAVGNYTLQVQSRPAAMNGCREVWVLSGVSVSDSITTSDCADTTASLSRFDVARMYLMAGTVVTLTERSGAIDPQLGLYRITGSTGDHYTHALVTSNDDSTTGNPTAFILDTIALSGPYDVVIGANAAGQTGAYTFDVSVAPGPSAPVPVAGARSIRDRLGLLKRSKH